MCCFLNLRVGSMYEELCKSEVFPWDPNINHVQDSFRILSIKCPDIP